MNPREKFKTRQPISEAKEMISQFLKGQQNINVAIINGNNEPVIDSIDYFYFDEQHIAVLTPMSKIKNHIGDKNEFCGFVQVGNGKIAQKLYATFNYQEIDSNITIIDELAKDNPQILKMRAHGAKFLKLTIKEATISLSDQEIYDLDSELNPTFAKFAPNGRERFENSRKILMEYSDREVIFNCVIENDTYFTLTKEDSNKITHITEGKTCKIYDGKDNHFETVIKIIPEKTEDIYQKLVDTNNAFFKENTQLVALCFKK